MKAWRATSWPSAMRWRLTWLAGLFPAVRWRGYDDPAAREEVGGPGACECTEFTCRVNGPYGKQCSLSRSSFRSSALQHEKETVAPPNQAGVQLDSLWSRGGGSICPPTTRPATSAKVTSFPTTSVLDRAIPSPSALAPTSVPSARRSSASSPISPTASSTAAAGTRPPNPTRQQGCSTSDLGEPA